MADLGFDFKTYSDLIAKRESSDNYKAQNRYGYLGRYQMGAPALIEAGYVKPGTKQSGLKDPRNWIIGNKDEFLYNPEFQDDAFYRYTKKQKEYIQQYGLIDPESDPTHIAGVLAGSHLVGAKNYTKSMTNSKIADANKVKPNEYYEYVRTGMENSQKPVASKDELFGSLKYLRNLFNF